MLFVYLVLKANCTSNIIDAFILFCKVSSHKCQRSQLCSPSVSMSTPLVPEGIFGQTVTDVIFPLFLLPTYRVFTFDATIFSNTT
ncbi:hypothetical protein VNO78_34742 [Psophocarpus tetragonolobus]|uniref:Uncharacterized protein n=1 Tax=Psophocarpus tetragonolobus TaxID=3891 RepID=A0AAN9RLP5_PSOTE